MHLWRKQEQARPYVRAVCCTILACLRVPVKSLLHPKGVLVKSPVHNERWWTSGLPLERLGERKMRTTLKESDHRMWDWSYIPGLFENARGYHQESVSHAANGFKAGATLFGNFTAMDGGNGTATAALPSKVSENNKYEPSSITNVTDPQATSGGLDPGMKFEGPAIASHKNATIIANLTAGGNITSQASSRLRGASVGTAARRMGELAPNSLHHNSSIPHQVRGRKRKTRRVVSVGRVSGSYKEGGEGKVAVVPVTPGTTPVGEEKVHLKAVTVKKDMAPDDIEDLLQEVLARLSTTERELRQLKKQGGVATTSRTEVRSRKFVIDKRATTLGAAFVGGFGGMVLGWSVLPNLWLVGAVGGVVTCALLSRTSGVAGVFCSTFGAQVALLYKDIRDWYEQTIFLYKTGKLSYTYFKVFEEYDRAWGLTIKYEEAKSRLSEEARELDRQYKIRAKTLKVGKQAWAISKDIGLTAGEGISQLSKTASGWSGRQLKLLKGWGGSEKRRRWGLPSSLRLKKVNGEGWSGRGASSGPDGSRDARANGNIGGISLWSLLVGNGTKSLYSAPPAGKPRTPGYRGEPWIPAPVRHLFMTKKQIRDERLRKYRVGFLGMRTQRSYDASD
ncbi:unnamed protein product [Choristocarpus tenellus]